jgi:hypothetical protein
LNIIYPNKFIFEKCWSIIYRQKRDNPNDAFGCKKMNIKDADGLRQAVISDLLENHLRAVRH